ncbi:AGE family epimerase/isomerase [Bacillus horti]|uniref:Cellobiose 2-epimerase n=2 Tax=Caldalkalibacillus horti TaxID=77523 RepID=A0ABT9VXY8_9BACI|nr:mannobiose 2-epimerase [Bacillus horti]
MNETRAELIEHILPFWMSLKDEQYGGYYGRVDYQLNVDRIAPKGGIAAARLLWTFSSVYRSLYDEKYLLHAQHAYHFLVDRFIDQEYGGLFWMVDHKGEAIDNDKHIYTQAFAVYALSEYYLATSDPMALEHAIKLFELIEEVGYNPVKNAYKEQFTRKWEEIPNDKIGDEFMAPITTNTHLHILEAYTTLYRAYPDERVKERLTNLIKIFYEKIYDRTAKCFHVFFDQNWKAIGNIKSYGHDIETSWLIDEALEAISLEDERYHQLVVDVAYNIADIAILPDGTIANEERDGKLDKTKVWWGQTEAMIGFTNAFQRTNDQRFLGLVEGIWDYVQNHLIDQRPNGEWYWSIEADGQPTARDIVEPWKCPYHNVRFCLEVMRRLGND